MSKREYWHLCRDMARSARGLEYLYATLKNPNPCMRPIHSLIIRSAIRDIHPSSKP